MVCSHYSIIILTETWLNKDISNEELGLIDYDIFRIDRDCTLTNKLRGGGVLIAIKKELQAKLIHIPFTNVEQIFIKFSFCCKNFIIGGVYIPPASDLHFYVNHTTTVDYILENLKNHEMIICGDYNIPAAIWYRDNFGLKVECTENSPANILLNEFSNHYLFQANQISNSRGVLLDLVFATYDFNTNIPDDYIFANSIHHSAICFSISTSTDDNSNSFEYEEYYYDFKNGNYIGICDYLASIFEDVTLIGGNINNDLQIFYDSLYSAIDHFIPIKKYKTSSFPVWFSSELKKMVYEKKIAHKNYKIRGDAYSYNIFTDLRTRCDLLKDQCYQNYKHKVENNILSCPGYFWKFINLKRKSYNLPSSMIFDNECAENNQDIVNLFSSYFSNVYSDRAVNDTTFHYNTTINISNYTITCQEIIDLCLSLPDKLTSGPDGIPLYFLKRCIFVITKPLCSLFNASLRLGIFPDYWKISYLKPIYKSGSRQDVRNYRAVCNQSELPKMLDCIISKKLTWDLKNIIIPQQHGFCQGRSTLSNLILYQNYLRLSFNNRTQVDSVYTDFTKAFDRISHQLLIAKLEGIGIRGNLLSWFGSYLNNRVQFVKYASSISNVVNVPSGVPQGSHMGPLLFNIFVNDISSVITESHFLMFADDIKIFRTINSVSDGQLLQDDLNRFSQWCMDNLLDLNLNKCFEITFSGSTNTFDIPYHINGIVLKTTNEIKDLGVIFDSKLTFVKHISDITSRALRTLGFIQRNSTDLSTTSLKILFCSLVRSILEYNSVIWSPNYEIHKYEIERVQRKFLRCCAYKEGILIENHDYAEISSFLNLKTLEHRRSELDLKCLHKIINGIIDCPSILSLIDFNANPKRTRFSELFKIPFCRTNHLQNESINRLMRTANKYNNQIPLFNSSCATMKNSVNKLSF